MDYIALGQRIRYHRRQKKLTQEQLAEQTGLSASFVGHIERGSRTASLETVMTFCKALEVTPNTLLLGTEVEVPVTLSEECRSALEKVIGGAYELAMIVNSARE